MNWVDQIKDVFLYNIKIDLHQNKGKQLNGLLTRMSKESMIPYRTLAFWHQESKHGPKAAFWCRRCGNYPIEVSKHGNPYTEKSKYFGLCQNCRKKSVQTDKKGGVYVKKR